MGMRWRGIEERRRGSAYVSAQGIGERQHEKTEWSAVPSDLLRFLGSKNLWPYWEQAYCKKGQQSLSSYCSMHQWAGVRSLWGRREKPWLAFAHLYGSNTSTMNNFKLPTRCHWTRVWEEMCSVGSCEPARASSAHQCWRSLCFKL